MGTRPAGNPRFTATYVVNIQSMSPGLVGIQIPGFMENLVKKIVYGHEIDSNFLLGRSRRAEPVPMLPARRCYAAVDRTTPPELGDTAD